MTVWDLGGNEMTIKNQPMKLNLQFFAEPDEPTDDPVDNLENKQGAKNNDDPKDDKTFTQSEVDSQISKAVEKAISNKRKEFEQEKQQAIEDAKKDAAEYAKMTKAQQEEADYNKRLKELEERERELNMKQLKSEVESDLKEEGLPTEFAGTLINLEDNEKIKEAITGIKKQFDEAVNNAVKEALRQDTPSSGDGKVTNNKNNKSKAEMARKARII